ncbi:MAG: calcium/sodium antiporter [Patescibacteria group bacterium]|nr:calcium/sodium antiporter [Patescibacteria group bacterium]
MLVYILFIIGFVLLIKGANLLVDGASSVAKRFGISNIVIGLTVVAFGTSAPELFVNVVASVQGNAGIAIGNILGSNISNILLVLGVTAFVYPITMPHNTVRKEIPLSLLAIFVVGFLINDSLIDNTAPSILTRVDGLILLSFFFVFMYYSFGIAKTGASESGEKVKKLGTSKAIAFILLGLLGLTLGGKWLVDGAVHIATLFGVSQTMIGLTIIAIGTSLPELAAAVAAARKKNPDIAVGTIVGSNIFNLFWILGISSIIKPLPFNPLNNLDIGVVIFASVLLLAFLLTGRRYRLEKWQGVVFVLTYIIYIIFTVLRG